MDQKMKTYSKPVIESIDIQSADCFMAMGTSDGHGQSSAPKREKEDTMF